MATDPLAAIPPPSDRRVAVRVTPDALRQIRGGHPWVYDTAIRSASPDAAAGTLAVVFDADRRFAAIGLWDPGSPIRLRVLHRGRPVAIDAAWWSTRVAAALERRRSLADDPTTTGYRALHGENDGFPGLVVDRYASTIVIKLYTSAWIPHLPVLVPIVASQLGAETVVLRLGRLVQRQETAGLADGATIHGPPPDGPVEFLEHGLRFEAAVVAGHKTGHFLDQRDNRRRVRELTAGADVLDVFSYTGGFSVYAAAGGARSVVSVDQSRAALDGAVRTFARNATDRRVAVCRHETIAGDAFAVMRDLARRGERYDLVVVDPPSFTAKAADVPAARRAYSELTQLAVGLLRPGGRLVQASCSARITADDFTAVVTAAARAAGRPLRAVERTGHAVDHPIGFPEGAYLKAVFGHTD